MRKLLFAWALLSSLVMLSPSAGAAPSDGSGYPFTDAYVATILGTPDALRAPMVKDIPVRLLDQVIFPDRKIPEVFWYNSELRSALAYQHGKAPLIFLIAGTGAGFNSSKMLALQSIYHQAGFHVVSISSPTHANFVTAASESGTPGIPREDAKDLYRVMQKIWDEIKGEVEVSDFYLSGYSLGGTQAAFVSLLDEEQKHFSFRKVLMINPAVSLYSSITRLDQMMDDNVPGGIQNTGVALDAFLQKLAVRYKAGDFVKLDHEFLYNIYRGLPEPPKNENLKALIGLSFRISSSNMIFASDVMTHAGFVVPKGLELGPTEPLGEYLRTLIYINFGKYMDELLLPAAQARDPKLTRQGLIDSASLQSIQDYLSRATKIGVITNADDIILAPGELDFLRQEFGSRATIFPHGGHCGNIDDREMAAALTQYFARP